MNIELFVPRVIDIYRTRDRVKLRLQPAVSIANNKPTGVVVELTFADDVGLQTWVDSVQAAKDKPGPRE